MPYVTVEPSKNKKLSDSRLIAIENISKQMNNKNYQNSIDLINQIDKNKKFFKLTIDQLNIAADFYEALAEI